MSCAIEVRDEADGSLAIDWPCVQRVVDSALADDDMPPSRLGLLLVDDATSAALHGEHFGDPTPTDVMTFPDGSLDPQDGRLLLGDVVVNCELAARLTAERSAGIRVPGEECTLYIIHGLLHILGYDDRDDADRRAMWTRQRELLAAVGIILEAEPG